VNATQTVKKRVYQTLNELPPEGFEELMQFLDFLKFKYLAKQPPEVVTLGGLWEDLNFDVTDEDVRALRQRVTAELLKKV
jgi:hypothetical protein